MEINSKLITYLEDLSFLSLTDAEKNRLAEDLKEILDGMACLEDLDTVGVTERSHPFDDMSAFRDDEAQASFPRELILKNAPNRNDIMFIAPKTVE